jgi:hypothetical protein
MDLDVLRKFSRGELAPKQFLSVYQDAGELLDILYEHLQPRELVVSVHDWPTPRRKPQTRQYFGLKTMLLITPLVLIGGSVFIFKYPLPVMISVAVWFAAFALVAFMQVHGKFRVERSREGKSVLVITNVRMIRVWLDGSEEVQSWPLKDDEPEEPMEPVSPTIKLLLEIDQGKISLN